VLDVLLLPSFNFHPADAEQHTWRISPHLTRSAGLSGMASNDPPTSFIFIFFTCCCDTQAIPTFFCTRSTYQRIDLETLMHIQPSIFTHSFNLLTHECKQSLQLRAIDLLCIKSVYFELKCRRPTMTLKLYSLGALDHACPFCRSSQIFINIPLLLSRYCLFDFLVCIFHPCDQLILWLRIHCLVLPKCQDYRIFL